MRKQETAHEGELEQALSFSLHDCLYFHVLQNQKGNLTCDHAARVLWEHPSGMRRRDLARVVADIKYLRKKARRTGRNHKVN